ncbi:uncharacterized protein LOC135198175 [Macrobrachium nipponense]|uniref:uncharacterized protein LOC135198175 n=1 Tax=Macrobrachium nipponense TaxID=159736 RepID=UPI0030C86B20
MNREWASSVAFSSWFFRTICLFWILAALPPIQDQSANLLGPGARRLYIGVHGLDRDTSGASIQENRALGESESFSSSDDDERFGHQNLPEGEEEPGKGVALQNATKNNTSNNLILRDVIKNQTILNSNGAVENSLEDLDKSDGCETVLENTERMIISIVKRDTMRLNGEGKKLSQRQSYSETVFQDSLTTRRIRHSRHKEAQLEKYLLNQNKEFTGTPKSPSSEVADDEGDIDNSLQNGTPYEMAPWQGYENLDGEFSNAFVSLTNRRARHNHDKRTRKTHSWDQVHKHLEREEVVYKTNYEKPPSTGTPTFVKSAPSKQPKMSKPYSYAGRSHVHPERREMNFKGYHRKIEIEQEVFRDLQEFQSDSNDIPNDLSTLLNTEISNTIEDSTVIKGVSAQDPDRNQAAMMTTVFSSTTTPAPLSIPTTARKRVYNYPKKPKKVLPTVKPYPLYEYEGELPPTATTNNVTVTSPPSQDKSFPTMASNTQGNVTDAESFGNVTTTAETLGDVKEKVRENPDVLDPAFIPPKLPFGPFIPNPKEWEPEEKKDIYQNRVYIPSFKPTYVPFEETGVRKKPSDFLMNVLSPLFGTGKKTIKADDKELLKFDNERSYNEEMFNRVSGSYMPSLTTKSPEAPLEGYPYIPGVRQDKNRIFTSSKLHGGFAYIDRNYNRLESYQLKLQGTEKSPRDQNLVIFGHVANNTLMDTLRNCTLHVTLNLTDHYNIHDLITESNNPLRQLIVYMNLISVSYEGYHLVLERAKRILDYLAINRGGLTVFSVIPTVADSINMTRSQEVKNQLINLNDDVLDYCAQAFPVCYGSTSLTDVLDNLKQTYKKSNQFDVYNSRGSGRKGACDSNEVCGTDTPPVPEDIQLPPSDQEQLRDLTGAVCNSTYHMMVELLVNLPTYDYEDYARAVANVKKESIRVRAQTGLVLHDILPRDLKQYDKNRPPKYEGHATIVYFHVTVLSVDSINEESMTYVADIFLAQSWRDHRLRLPENMTEEYRILDVEWLHNIWRPDCFFKNAKRVTFHEMSVPNHYLWLYHDKTLLYMAKLTLVLSCAMKFEAYPHDTQICSMMIESLSHTTHDLVFKWNETDPLVVNPDIELPQLDISRNNTEDCTLTYSTGNFTCLAVVFNLRRRLGYHLFHTYVPSAITVVMSWISFWIKPEAIPARVTLGVTSLLTLATQNQQSQSSLPPVSYIKAIDVWMSSCTVFVFASLLQFGIVNYFMEAEPLSKDMTGYSVEDLTDLDEKKSEDGRLNGYSRSRSRSRMRSRSPGVPQYVVHRCTGKDIALYIDKFSRLFFPFAFFILNVSYWTTYGTM